MPAGTTPPSPTFSPSFPSGLVLQPFRALRYDPTRSDLSAVTSPPYDVIDAAGVAALEQASDVNVVRLILPRDERSEGDRYLRAANTLHQWRDAGVLIPDAEAALYVYEQSSSHHVQRGILGALALSPPEDNIVLPHENTMAGTVSDRLALYTAVEADLEPIFLVYAGGGAASAAVAAIDTTPPLADVTLSDGLRHRLWALTDPDQLAQIAQDLHPRTAMIADGHHRYATYLQRQSAAHRAGRGRGPWDFGLTFLVDSTAFGPEVHPIHRVIVGVDLDTLAERAAEYAEVSTLPNLDLDTLAAVDGPAFLLARDRHDVRLVHRLDPDRVAAALPADRSAAWRGLDVSVLHHVLISTIWEVTDDVEHVGYEHDVDAALRTAASTGGTAVLLKPTAVDQVTAVAAQGERMPRKSTLFTPKPRTGFVIRDHRNA